MCSPALWLRRRFCVSPLRPLLPESLSAHRRCREPNRTGMPVCVYRPRVSVPTSLLLAPRGQVALGLSTSTPAPRIRWPDLLSVSEPCFRSMSLLFFSRSLIPICPLVNAPSPRLDAFKRCPLEPRHPKAFAGRGAFFAASLVYSTPDNQFTYRHPLLSSGPTGNVLPFSRHSPTDRTEWLL